MTHALVDRIKCMEVPDVESLRDLDQYYNGRFFGVMIDRALTPALYGGSVSNTDFTCTVKGVNRIMTWEAVRENTDNLLRAWGIPLLGNTVFGDSYVFISVSGRREAAKGLGFSSASIHLMDPPGYGGMNYCKFLQRPKAEARNAYREVTAQGGIDNRSIFAGVLAEGVYSPKFWGYEEALSCMYDGERVGCPLSYTLGLHFIKKKARIGVYDRSDHVGWVEDGDIVLLDSGDHVLRYAIEQQLQGNWRVR